MEYAKRLQRKEFQELQEHNSENSPGDDRSSSPYNQAATFHMDQDFPPLSREILVRLGG